MTPQQAASVDPDELADRICAACHYIAARAPGELYVLQFDGPQAEAIVAALRWAAILRTQH